MHRDFKGVWIPKEIWLSQELTLQEKVMLVEIDSLDNEDGCYASNQYFADFFQLSKSRCSEIIASLEKDGFITVTHSKERRVIRVNRDRSPLRETEAPLRNVEAPPSENRSIYIRKNNTDINNTVNKRDARARFTPPSLQEIKDYAKSRSSSVDPQAFYDYFTAGEWQDSKGNKVKNWKQKFITWENMNGRNDTTQRPDRCLDKGQYDDLV